MWNFADIIQISQTLCSNFIREIQLFYCMCDIEKIYEKGGLWAWRQTKSLASVSKFDGGKIPRKRKKGFQLIPSLNSRCTSNFFSPRGAS